jgi:hypothetical protein
MEENEPYVFKLSPMFSKIAEDELRETDYRRAQSLIQLKEWITKNPNIKMCRTGKKYLYLYFKEYVFNICFF